jgi:hypothetical protein
MFAWYSVSAMGTAKGHRADTSIRPNQAINEIDLVNKSMRTLAFGLLPAGREHHDARRPNLYSFIAPVALDRDA